MFTKKTNKTTKTTTSKKETEKKVEGKNPEIETKDEAFKSLLKDLSKLKGVRGYIVLVDTQTEKEKGFVAHQGVLSGHWSQRRFELLCFHGTGGNRLCGSHHGFAGIYCIRYYL